MNKLVAGCWLHSFRLVAHVLPLVSGCSRGFYDRMIHELCLANFKSNLGGLDPGLWCSWPDTMEWVHWDTWRIGWQIHKTCQHQSFCKERHGSIKENGHSIPVWSTFLTSRPKLGLNLDLEEVLDGLNLCLMDKEQHLRGLWHTLQPTTTGPLRSFILLATSGF